MQEKNSKRKKEINIQTIYKIQNREGKYKTGQRKRGTLSRMEGVPRMTLLEGWQISCDCEVEGRLSVIRLQHQTRPGVEHRVPEMYGFVCFACPCVVHYILVWFLHSSRVSRTKLHIIRCHHHICLKCFLIH